MTQTTRRTAKLSTPTYVPAALFRVYDKVTGVCLGYLAPSEDGAKTHQVTCDEYGDWHCTCEGNAKWHRTCHHIKAACELCAIRVKQGRPACRAAALPEVAEETAQPTISDEEMARIAAIAHQAAEEKQAAAAQHQAELEAAKTRANYEAAAEAQRQAESARREAAPLNGARRFPGLPLSWAEIEAQRQAQKAS